ncbi:MAG: hypothetical protein JJE25_04270 [Bacteroidia bacterium]|nr:hypothetical protein [Bacteroidia bacterium]
MNKKIFHLLLPLALLAAGLYFVPINIYQSDFSKVPGDFGDARFNNYILEHGYKFLRGDADKYWDAPFMYPYRNVVALSDNLIGTVPLYSMFRILGSDRETSFQLWLLALFALNFICCYWALIKWSNDFVLSSAGAYIFAFSIFILGHITNAQVFPRFMVPLIFYWSWQYLTQKKIKYFLFTVLATVYQFYCGIYLGFFLLYTLLFFFIAYIIIYKDKTLFHQFKTFEITASHLLVVELACVLLLPLMLPYIEISHKLGMRIFEDTVSSIPTFRSYFFTSHAPILWRFLAEHAIPYLAEWWSHFLFTGALPWLSIIIIPLIMISKKTKSTEKTFIAFLSFGLFFSFIFSLNINGFTLYKIIFQIPGFSAMRAINRVINTEIMFFVLIFVFVFSQLQNYGRIYKMLIMIFPMMAIIDNLIDPREVVRFDKRESQQQIEKIKEKIKNQYDKKFSAIAFLPADMKGKEIEMQLNTMLAAQELNVPCVNAYSGAYPKEYINFFSHADDESLKAWHEFNSPHANENTIQIIDDFEKKVIGRKRIHLKADNGKFVCADNESGNSVIANRDNGWLWETFYLIIFENNECAIRAYNGSFFSVESEGQNKISASGKNVNAAETFILTELSSGYVAFKASNGKYIGINVSQNYGQLFAGSDSIGSKERFILIVD